MGKKSKKSKTNTVTGILELAYEGYGFVVSGEKGVQDVFIPAHAIGDALHKDKVEITVQPGRGGKTEGRILRVLERGRDQFVGRFEVRGQSAIVVTDDFRVRKMVVIPKKMESGARHNETVVVRITSYPSGDQPIVGEVVKRIGVRGTDQTEMGILLARHQLPEGFSENVSNEAKEMADRFSGEDFSGRQDLRPLPFMTIDGEDAKDFDDAVCAQKMSNGSYKVWVAIADVSHFVREGSYVDREAAKRTTSVYLPGVCIPMLPEELSTNICSLLPGEDRFCFTAEMIINPEGHVGKSRFYRSVIKSKYRMTYTEAYEYLDQNKKIETSEDVLESLQLLNEAAACFRKQRRNRGSMDFDLPEPSIILDLTGKPENIVKAERNMAHMLIEDLMIAANEAVATYLTRRNYPCVYRVHDIPDPEKLFELKTLLKYLGHNVKIQKDPTPKSLANVVRIVRGRAEERLINMLLLRSMAQAVYSTENIGHFGLASTCYCHFTSPIRRYPDLLVHRLLSDALGIDDSKWVRQLKYLKFEAQNCSKMERRSMEAERESLALYSAIFMRDKIGEVFEGYVSHTAKKGVFVELIEYFIEGLIKPEDLSGDRYRYDPKKFSYVGRKTGRSIHIGDKIKVVVKDVSTEERQIYFEPTD